MLSFLCRHDFYWSERHRADRCRRCGHLRAGEGQGPTRTGSLAALLATGDEAAFIPPPPPQRDPIFEDWDRLDAAQPVMPAGYAFVPAVRSEPEPEPEPEAELASAPAAETPAMPTPVPSIRNGGSSLLSRIEHLASGGELSRGETIDALLALIEDGQSSDPVVFGPAAAAWYARLYAARQAGSTVTD